MAQEEWESGRLADKLMEKMAFQRPSIPRPSDIISSDDIEVWMRSAIRAGMPEFEDAIGSALARQEKILHDVTLMMIKSLDRQAQLMQRTIALQARSILLGGVLVGITVDRELPRWKKVGYGLLSIGGFFLLERLQEGYIRRSLS